MGQKMSREETDTRRARAANLFKRGFTQAEVARRLRVTRQSAMRWHRAYQQGGAEALRPKKRGRPGRLTSTQLEQFEKALLKGPKAHGWSSELWTLERVAALLRRMFDVNYHIGH